MKGLEVYIKSGIQYPDEVIEVLKEYKRQKPWRGDKWSKLRGISTQLQRGNGIGVRLYGYKGEFKIALKKGFDIVFEKEYWKVIYANEEEGVYFEEGPYCGGNTGFGVRSYNIKPLSEIEYKMVTLEELNEIVRQEEEKRRLEREKEEREWEEWAEKIRNRYSTPKEFELGNGVKLQVGVSIYDDDKPDKKPYISLSLVYGGRAFRIWVSDYVGVDGRLLRKKFVKDFGYLPIKSETLDEIGRIYNNTERELYFL